MPETQTDLLKEILKTTKDSACVNEANAYTLTSVAAEMARMGEQIKRLSSDVSELRLLDKRVTQIEARIEGGDRAGNTYRWLIGIVAAAFLGLLAIAANHLGWRP